MADKTRIQDLAKELGVESKTVLAKLQELGEYVKSASSHVEAPVARRLRAAFEGEDALQANAESHVGGRLESASAPSFGDHAIKSPRANPIVQTVGGNDEDSKQQQIAGALPASQQVSSPSDVSSSDVDKHIIDTNESVIASPTLSVMIYLSDVSIHEHVEAQVELALTQSGWIIDQRDDPIVGSWFRAVTSSDGLHDIAKTAAHAAEMRLVQHQDAIVTSVMMQHVPALIASLQQTRDAVVRIQAVLILKIDWSVAVHQLTAAQQFKLDHYPKAVLTPQDVLRVLNSDAMQRVHSAADCTQQVPAISGPHRDPAAQ